MVDRGKIIDGKAIAAQLRQELKSEVESLREKGTVPGLTVILVGNNQASETYVRGKIKACAEVGIHSDLVRMSPEITEDALLDKIRQLNVDSSVHGILVQLPLPDHISPDRILSEIDPDKDVDGFHPINAGRLVTGLDAFLPCTPHGILELLKRTGIEIAGKHAVVVGRSNIVGKPISILLQRENATVTMCHSRTVDLKSHTRQADILVAAVGKLHVITADHVKPDSVVIDVGMNRDENGKLAGDVDFEGVRPIVSYITPVPGGVGPMTIAMLLYNTCQSAKMKSR